MAQRRIGQETFQFGAKAERQTSLDELGSLIDWSIASEPLAALYRSPKGEKAWPPLAIIKALLLAARSRSFRRRARRGAFRPGELPPRLCPRRSNPRAHGTCSASGASLSNMASIKACLPPLRAILRQRALASAKTRRSTRR
jgi:hypothetical protein